MMPRTASWLPRSALAGRHGAAPVIACLAEWSKYWSARPLAARGDRWKECSGASGLPEDFDTAFESAGFALRLRKADRTALVSALLGRSIAERDLRTAQDRCAIDHLLQTALGDLGRRLEKALPPLPDWEMPLRGGAERWLFECGTQGAASLLRIEAAPGLLVRIAREAAGPPRQRQRPHSPHGAFDSAQLRLAAMIGGSRFSLAEFEALAVGDVLPLDTPLSAPVAACLNGRKEGERALSLVPQESGFLLQIERPPSQW